MLTFLKRTVLFFYFFVFPPYLDNKLRLSSITENSLSLFILPYIKSH
ncbi:hypothetical protein GCWU000282_00915 [Catonella morbi ATCC 51271]|uniref:Uncharacterized protein n=1 Tax=Catonella morbi ATCC 51271 TaxID=592026 RepID=V2ZA01_9FIRM|nr:hypothetical protein GCWU000282_00915 [Catonella morbi ATCC 51271]